MKRRTYLKTMLAAGAGIGCGSGRGRRASHPVARGSVRRSGQREGDAAQLRDHLSSRGLKHPGYIDVKMLKLRSTLMGKAPAGRQLPVRADLSERRTAAEVGGFGRASESVAHHREHALDEELHGHAVRRGLAGREEDSNEGALSRGPLDAAAGGARAPGAAHRAHRSIEVPTVQSGPRWSRPTGLHGPVRCSQPRHQPLFPASRRDSAEERHRRPLSQSVRGDVRHLRRRGAVHHRRADFVVEGTGRRALPDGTLARHLQSHRQAGAVDEHQRLRDEGHVRRLRSRRCPRGRAARSDPGLHDHAAGSRAASPGERA